MTFFGFTGLSDAFVDHLNFDAVVAFADGEMSLSAYQRAAAHLARCEQCAAEVAEQTSAREALRSAFVPRMPGSLFEQLRSIPVALPAVSSPNGRDSTSDPTGGWSERRPRFGSR
ncbi:anti-sigma factor family protein [Nakamurella aerolata]|uniref:Zf-HC2 domain-containing protein n=1 Tax=Nakamurella aerolata TaxID=1656892 RepID=A0A849A0R9_9ACTN|nr:zf-HC2 domain-containing protein [Nakamurella aerolata]NNG34185.1 zf-HC2 domain-containing protein [Nakamurella aerolata]